MEQIINKTESQSSFECGSPTKGRIKIYFNKISELCEKLKKLKEVGIIIENVPELK